LSEPDDGIYDAMNKGLRLATGDYVGFVNSDDFLARPDALSLVAETARKSGADCIFADTLFVHESGSSRWARLYSAGGFRPWWLRIGMMPPHPSMFVRRELLLRLGGFDTKFEIAGDFDLIARAILKNGATWTNLDVVTTRFRTGGVSTMGMKAKQKIGREMAVSLRSLRQPWPSLAVFLRFPFKLAQFRRVQADDTLN
jgi:glycosyltransferase involved in cell wall biosynthesis